MVGVPLAAAALIGVVAVNSSGDQSRPDRVRTSPGPGGESPQDRTTTTSPSSSSTTFDRDDDAEAFGGLEGATLEVTPRIGIADGQRLTVVATGVGGLPDAVAVLCAGDVSVDDPIAKCDLTHVVDMTSTDGASPGDPVRRDFVARRVLTITWGSGDVDGNRAYDCLTEAAGCVLAVGTTTGGTRGIASPLAFRDEALPTPRIAVTPADGLDDGHEVDVELSGVRPNSSFVVSLCRTDAAECDEIEFPTATSGPEGRARTTLTLRAAIYGWKGRVDCVRDSCSVLVREEGGVAVAAARIRFADGVVAPVPQLSIDPPGPYRDKQRVTVRGTGFPPGFELSRWLGICPADKDPAVEERCVYPGALTREFLVDANGRFEADMSLFDNLATAGSCVDNITGGCLLSWVLNHGPAAASVPLEFIE